MKIAIYMKFYVDAVDIWKCILSPPRFHTEKAKWSYVLKREEAQARHTSSSPGMHTCYTPLSTVNSSIFCSNLLSYFSAWACYKAVYKAG